MARGHTDPVTGITEGAMKTLLRSNLRPIWRRTSRKKFLESIRFKSTNPKTGRNWFAVKCAGCGRVMGASEKERRPLVGGGLSKKPRSVFEVHHKAGITQLTNIRKDLGEFWHSMIYGQMEVLCYACHKDETAKQSKERNQ